MKIRLDSIWLRVDPGNARKNKVRFQFSNVRLSKARMDKAKFSKVR